MNCWGCKLICKTANNCNNYNQEEFWEVLEYYRRYKWVQWRMLHRNCTCDHRAVVDTFHRCHTTPPCTLSFLDDKEPSNYRLEKEMIVTDLTFEILLRETTCCQISNGHDLGPLLQEEILYNLFYHISGKMNGIEFNEAHDVAKGNNLVFVDNQELRSFCVKVECWKDFPTNWLGVR